MFTQAVNQSKEKAIHITEITLTMADKMNGEHYGAAARLAIDSRVLTDALSQIGELHARLPALEEKIDAVTANCSKHDYWIANWEKRFTGKAWIAFTIGYACGAWSLIDLIVRLWPFIFKSFGK